MESASDIETRTCKLQFGPGARSQLAIALELYDLQNRHKDTKSTEKSENDENTLGDEGNDSGELPRWAWAVIFIPTLIFVIIASGTIDLQFGDGGTDGTNPSEWPSVEGTITDTFVLEQLISEEYQHPKFLFPRRKEKEI